MLGKSLVAAAAVLGTMLCAGAAGAAEFTMGEPVQKDHMQFSPDYLTGIEMDRHPLGMSMDPQAIHIELDIHSAAGETHGFRDNAWIPYLTVRLTVEKAGGGYKETKPLAAMVADDGPHYANNFGMAGPGEYTATYVVEPPSSNGVIRHVDRASGVPAWWKPITVSWTFEYPGKPKAE